MDAVNIYSKMVSYLKFLGFRDAVVNNYQLDDKNRNVTIFFAYNNANCCGGNYVEDKLTASYVTVFS